MINALADLVNNYRFDKITDFVEESRIE